MGEIISSSSELTGKSDVHDYSKIILKMDTYDDLFSDFDPRQVDERALSFDFLDELKRASKSRGDITKLDLLIPKEKRITSKEPTIRRRLKDHFHKHFHFEKKEKSRIIRKGLSFVFAGIFFMLIASFLLFKYAEKTFLISFLIILLEPAGWFSFWEGLNQIIFDSKKETPDFKFYEKMSEAEVYFMSY